MHPFRVKATTKSRPSPEPAPVSNTDLPLMRIAQSSQAPNETYMLLLLKDSQKNHQVPQSMHHLNVNNLPILSPIQALLNC